MESPMNAFSTTRRTSQGFSLVELLVALVFTAFLMAGMARVFQSSVRTYTAVNETMSAQRTNRWAMDQVSDDISQAGLVFPDRVLPTIVTGGAESLFSVTPNTTVTCTRVSDTDPTATQSETVTADALEFFTDVPLAVAGTWATDTPGDNANPGGTATAAPTSAQINFTLGSYTDVQAGDVMVILDAGQYGNWEHPVISGCASDGTVSFQTNTAQLLNYSASLTYPGITLAHKAGVPVYFIRPNQLVRYSVQAVALDPSNAAVKLPCLVRQQANYPTSGNVDWTTVPTQIVSENTQGFQVDLSFDGGKTWARPTAAPFTWAAMQANANTQLATVGLPGLITVTDPANPDWFRSINCLMRVDITTRAPIRREEYSITPGSRAYRTRTQTLMISPRNFGVGK